MKRKHIVLCLVMILTMLVFTGCGSKEEKGDKRFTYDWKIYSIESNGKTTYIEAHTIYGPKFSSSDGVTCVFSNNGKDHNGTLTKLDEDLYSLEFEDSKADTKVEISEDTMTLTINDKMVLVFKRAD